MTEADVEKFVPRKDYLKAEYGFTCDCERCKLEAALPDSDDEGGGPISASVFFFAT